LGSKWSFNVPDLGLANLMRPNVIERQATLASPLLGNPGLIATNAKYVGVDNIVAVYLPTDTLPIYAMTGFLPSPGYPHFPYYLSVEPDEPV